MSAGYGRYPYGAEYGGGYAMGAGYGGYGGAAEYGGGGYGGSGEHALGYGRQYMYRAGSVSYPARGDPGGTWWTDGEGVTRCARSGPSDSQSTNYKHSQRTECIYVCVSSVAARYCTG